MDEPFESHGIYGVLHRPDAPRGEAIALTHGAGSNHNAPLLVKMARAFAGAGYLALRYDLPFRRQRPKGPPFPAAAARDREGVAAAIAALRTLAAGTRLRRRPFLRRTADRHGWPRNGRAWPTRCCCSPIRCIRRTGPSRSAPRSSPTCARRRCSSTAPPTRSARPKSCARPSPLIPARTDVLPVEGAAHDLKRARRPRRRASWSAFTPCCRSAILEIIPPEGHHYARIPLYDSPRDRGHSHRLEGQLPQGAEAPAARPGPPPWDLSFLGIRVSRAVFALGHRLHLPAARDRLLRPRRGIPPAERARREDLRRSCSRCWRAHPALGRVRAAETALWPAA